ncbi:hypothetical protein V8D89_001409 [Ganoderma adspersum]
MLRIDNLPSPQPLNTNFAHSNSNVVSTYTNCRLAERLVEDDRPLCNESEGAKLVNIRILGHLLCQSYFLSEHAISEVASAVLSCRNSLRGVEDADVEELNKLVRKFKQQSSQGEGDGDNDNSSSLSPSSFRLTEVEVDQMLAENPVSHYTLRKLAMHREDYRCIATRILDYACALRLRTPNDGMYDGDVDSLDICRILPDPPNANLEQGESTRNSCANVYGVLSRLGNTDIVNHLVTADQGPLLENVMVLTRSLLHRFDALEMWFEPVEDAPNCYSVSSILKPPHGLTKGQQVTFHSTDPRLPLPSREFLSIHAACCRVAHLSDMTSNPGPTMEAPEFAKALHAHLEDLSFAHAGAN